MNIQPTGLNMNYSYTKASKNNDSTFSSLLNQSLASESNSSAPVYDKVNVKNTSYNSSKQFPSNYQSSSYVGGRYFDDSEFAKCFQEYDKETVNTDNPINWGTTGDHQLTETEIDTLKSKYDVTNLSTQEFYDLMADLSNLNAISTDEIVSRYHYKSEIPLFEKAMVLFPGQITEGNYHSDKPINNLIEELEGRRDYFSARIDSVKSLEFKNLNKFVFDMDSHADLLKEFKVASLECYEGADHYLEIISSLIHNP